MPARLRPTDLARALRLVLSVSCGAAFAQPQTEAAPQQQQAEAPLPASYAAPQFNADDNSAAARSDADKTPKTAATKDTKVVINAKPEPDFADEVKRNSIQGIVRLRVTLTHDGRVTNPLIIRSLTHGLTMKALRAALNIKFTPAQKNGRPVAQAVMLEYNFHVF